MYMENFGNGILLEGSASFLCGTLHITWQFPRKCYIVRACVCVCVFVRACL